MPALSERIAADVWPAITAFGRWWAAELHALVPRGFMVPTIGVSPRADIRPGRTEVEIVRVAKGEGERFVESRTLGAFDEENWAETASLIAGHKSRVLLRAPLIHVLTLRLPKAARSHLLSAIPLQLRDHAPLLPELLEWKIVDTRIDGQHLIVRVVIVRISTLDDITSGFLNHDLALPPIFAELDNERVVPLRDARRSAGRAQLSRPLWIAAGIVVSTPLWILLVLHLLVLDQRAKVSAAEELAQPKLAAERRLRDKAALGVALKAVLGHPSVTATIEDLAARLPASVHAVDISETDSGSLDFTLQTTTPEMVPPVLAKDALLVGAREAGRSKTADGAFQLHYATVPR